MRSSRCKAGVGHAYPRTRSSCGGSCRSSIGGTTITWSRFVAAGLTPLAALQTATLNPAKYLHATDSLGTVAPGKLADLVLLDADPLADIRHTRTIRAVVANGRYFDRAALDRLAAGVERTVRALALPRARQP